MVKHLKAKVYVFSESVLSKSAEARAKRIQYFVDSPQYCELDNIDGESVVFERKIFPGHTTLLRVVKVLMEKELIQPQFRGPHHLHVNVQRY